MSQSPPARDPHVIAGCIHVSTRAGGEAGGYNEVMSKAHIIGLAIAIAGVAALCLLSTTTATFVAIATLIAVGIDGFRERPRTEIRQRAVMIDLSTRDYIDLANEKS